MIAEEGCATKMNECCQSMALVLDVIDLSHENR